MRILLVEDDPRVASFIAKGLREQTYAVDVAPDGEQGVYRAQVNDYDLVILDIALPIKDGYSVCRDLRAGGFRTPVLMLTARGSVDDRVTGLDCGADDYLTKPFEFKELLARLRALARRPTALLPQILRAGDLAVDTGAHAASVAGAPLTLTAKEYALLEYLVLNQGRVLGREQIAQHVWDESFDPLSNIIDVYIKRLRAKLGDSGRLIRTRRGEGYMLSAGREGRDE